VQLVVRADVFRYGAVIRDGSQLDATAKSTSSSTSSGVYVPPGTCYPGEPESCKQNGLRRVQLKQVTRVRKSLKKSKRKMFKIQLREAKARTSKLKHECGNNSNRPFALSRADSREEIANLVLSPRSRSPSGSPRPMSPKSPGKEVHQLVQERFRLRLHLVNERFQVIRPGFLSNKLSEFSPRCVGKARFPCIKEISIAFTFGRRCQVHCHGK
jgi:hypothetical protein